MYTCHAHSHLVFFRECFRQLLPLAPTPIAGRERCDIVFNRQTTIECFQVRTLLAWRTAREQDLSVCGQSVNGFASTVPCQPSRLLVSCDMFDPLTPQHISTRPPSRPGLMRQVKVGGLSGGAGGRGGRGRREEQQPSDTAEEDNSP